MVARGAVIEAVELGDGGESETRFELGGAWY